MESVSIPESSHLKCNPIRIEIQEGYNMKREAGVLAAIDEMAHALPFTLKGLDADNGSEFINLHLADYCK